MKYRAVEIWVSDWHVSTELGDYIFKNEVTKKIPLFLLLLDERFQARLKSKLPPEKEKNKNNKKKLVIKIKYLKKIGDVNGIV